MKTKDKWAKLPWSDFDKDAALIRKYEHTYEDIDYGDLRQLAGLLEGEGYFSINQCLINLVMTDADVMRWAARFFASPLFGRQPKEITTKGKPYKYQYRTFIRGRYAVALASRLRPYMGVRRQLTIDKMITKYNMREIRGKRISSIPKEVWDFLKDDKL